MTETPKSDSEILPDKDPKAAKPTADDEFPEDRGHEYRGSLESTTNKPEKRKIGLKTKVGVGLAATALLIGGGSVAAKNAMNPEHPQTTGPAPANTSPSAEPTAEVSPTELTIDEQLAQQEKFEAYAPAIEQYATMDVATFEELPLDERLPYAQYILDSMVIFEGYEAQYGEGSKFHDYMLEPVIVSSDNTGQEILDSHLYAIQRSYMLCGAGDDDWTGTDEGNKALSSAYSSVGKNKLVTNAYLDAKELQRERDESIGLYNKYIALDASELLKGENKDGEEVLYKVLKVKNQDGRTYHDLFVYHEFTNYDGAKKAVWLLDSQTTKADNILKWSASGIKQSSP